MKLAALLASGIAFAAGHVHAPADRVSVEQVAIHRRVRLVRRGDGGKIECVP